MPAKNRKMKKLGDTLVDGDTVKLPPGDVPKAQRSPLLPPRWWEHHAMAHIDTERRQPIIVVSHQVAEVLNMGIDRVVDIASLTKTNLQVAQDQVLLLRYHHDRLLEFLHNTRDSLSTATSTTLVDRTVQVVEAIVALLNEDRP